METDRPRILYVSNYHPGMDATGARHRALNIGLQLSKLGEVTYVYLSSTPSEVLDATSMEPFAVFHAFNPVDYRGPQRWKRFCEWFDFHWPWGDGCQLSTGDATRFEALLRRHDLVWFHTLRPADATGRVRFDNSILDLDDLNHLKHAGREANTFAQKVAQALLVWKWKRKEMQSLDRFTAVTVCSDKDRQILGSGENIFVVSNGFETPEKKPDSGNRNPNRIGFIGKLDYGPNVDGMQWFCREVLPLLRKQRPEMTLRVVGKVPEGAEYLNTEGVETLGYLDHPEEEFTTWSAMIVPIRFGGGTRIKILEAFSRMCPVVSTSAGAYGIDAENEKHLLIADEIESFGQRCLTLADNPEKGRTLAEAAWELFQKKYTWDRIGENVREAVEYVLKKNGHS